MAKGQKRSTKEIRKPKKEKGVEKPSSTFGSQVKQSPPTLPSARGSKS